MQMDTLGSKEGQDCFVSRLLGSRVFLDIGCSNGLFRNNTLMLEQAGWKGWLFDRNIDAVNNCMRTRKSPAIQVDASTFDFGLFLKENNAPKTIDYISFDVDSSTVKAVRNFPFEEYEFLIMTIEHDLYRGETAKAAIMERFAAMPQYVFLLNNAECAPGKPFEDWIVNARYFPPNLLTQRTDNVGWWDFLDGLRI